MRYFVAWVDEARTRCVRMTLSEYGVSDAEVRGLALDIEDMWVSEDVRSCTLGSPNSGNPYTQHGRIEFADLVETEIGSVACSIQLDLDIRPNPHPDSNLQFDWDRIEVAATVPVLAEGCSRPVTATSSLTELSAAQGVLQDIPTLVVAGWDANLEVCAWARLLDADALESVPETAVEAPGTWVYTGVRLGLLEREACVADNFVFPPINPTYPNESAAVLDSSGTIEIRAGSEDEPCELDIALELQTRGGFYWLPETLAMKDNAVAVSGTCG